jgi:hypothetical protein
MNVLTNDASRLDQFGRKSSRNGMAADGRGGLSGQPADAANDETAGMRRNELPIDLTGIF